MGARGVFLLRADLLSVEVRNLLQTVARVVIVSRRGGLAEQVKRLQEIAPGRRTAASQAGYREPSRVRRAAAARVLQRNWRI